MCHLKLDRTAYANELRGLEYANELLCCNNNQRVADVNYCIVINWIAIDWFPFPRVLTLSHPTPPHPTPPHSMQMSTVVCKWAVLAYRYFISRIFLLIDSSIALIELCII